MNDDWRAINALLFRNSHNTVSDAHVKSHYLCSAGEDVRQEEYQTVHTAVDLTACDKPKKMYIKAVIYWHNGKRERSATTCREKVSHDNVGIPAVSRTDFNRIH